MDDKKFDFWVTYSVRKHPVNASLEYDSVRVLAAQLLFLYHGSPEREDCRGTADLIHMAPQIIFQDLDRSNCSVTPRQLARIRFHVNSVLLRLFDDSSVPALVPQSICLCWILTRGLLMEYLQWLNVLHRCFWQTFPKRAGGHES